MFEKCSVVDPWLFLSDPNLQSFITDQDPGGQFTVSGSYVPEIIDPVFAKTSQNARFLLSENERFGSLKIICLKKRDNHFLLLSNIELFSEIY